MEMSEHAAQVVLLVIVAGSFAGSFAVWRDRRRYSGFLQESALVDYTYGCVIGTVYAFGVWVLVSLVCLSFM